MLNPLKLKMILCKIFTFWIIPAKTRKLVREFLFWFSFDDYRRFKNANYHIVSLGSSCLSRAMPVAARLKPRRFYGEMSCPFDLYFSTDLDRTTRLIENNFSDFFQSINLDAFPHDDKLTVKQFKKRYKNRIQNFLDVQNSDKIIYYIYSNYDKVPETAQIKRLYQVLKAKRGAKPFELIILTNRQIDVENVIQLPYSIKFNDSKAIEYIINRYKDYDNKYTVFCNYMKEKLKEIIHP